MIMKFISQVAPAYDESNRPYSWIEHEDGRIIYASDEPAGMWAGVHVQNIVVKPLYNDPEAPLFVFFEYQGVCYRFEANKIAFEVLE